AHNSSRHEGVDITVGKDDKSGAKSREDYVLELIGEVGGVKQAQRPSAQNISTHRLFQFAADQHGPFQADVDCWIAASFEPVSQQIHLCGSAGAVGAFNDNELSLQLFEVGPGDSFSVKAL